MFSDEGYEEVLEDSEDELVAKKRVFDSDKDDGGEREADAMGMCLLPLSGLFFFWQLSGTILDYSVQLFP